MIKLFPKKTIVKLTNIINAIFRFRHFLKQWKQSHIIVIPKPGKDSTFPQNYRPISLLSNLSKITEKIIQVRLLNDLQKSNIIPPKQYGFIKNHDTNLQLLRVTDHIIKGFNNKQKTDMILFDVEKAFDRVWHPGLIAKLCKAKVNFRIIELIDSFLSNRSFQIQTDRHLSTTRKIEAGVPQGAVLSPTLYNVYTHDIPKHPKTDLALYADDTAIYTTSKSEKIITERLQEHTDHLLTYYNKWGIRINPQKTQAILISKHRKTPYNNIKINNDYIIWAKQVKYLGLIIDSGLTYNQHLKYQANKARGAPKQLYPLLCP